MTAESDRYLPGSPYYIVTFADADLRIPVVQTLIFERAGDRADGSVYFLFRELQSNGQETCFAVDEDDANHLVLDQNELIEKLTGCFDGRLASSPSD